MSFKIVGKLSNGLSVQKKLKAFEKTVKERQINAMREAVLLIHETAVKSIQDNSSGIPTVRYSNGRKRHVLVSKPGEPPNTDTGRLVQSIKFDFQNGGLTGRVGTNLKYGAYLEFGTSDNRPAKRPWLAPAVALTAKYIAKIFADAMNRSVKDVT